VDRLVDRDQLTVVRDGAEPWVGIDPMTDRLPPRPGLLQDLRHRRGHPSAPRSRRHPRRGLRDRRRGNGPARRGRPARSRRPDLTAPNPSCTGSASTTGSPSSPAPAPVSAPDSRRARPRRCRCRARRASRRTSRLHRRCDRSRHLLRLIRQLTLVLSGDDDPPIPTLNAQILSRGIPHAQVHLYRGGRGCPEVRGTSVAAR
jgi:pimeloyl-ACP methyl ester carboxylesterase